MMSARVQSSLLWEQAKHTAADAYEDTTPQKLYMLGNVHVCAICTRL